MQELDFQTTSELHARILFFNSDEENKLVSKIRLHNPSRGHYTQDV